MKTTQEPVDRADSRDVVADLHAALLLLLDRGYSRPPESSADQLRPLIDEFQFELESGAFGDVTKRLMLHCRMQPDGGDYRAEFVDPDTAVRLKDILASLRALIQGRSWTIHGYVTDADGEPIKERRICLFARGLAKLRRLGEATTDPEGYYEVSFTEPQLGDLVFKQSGPDVFIGVFDDCGHQIAQSPTISVTEHWKGSLNLALSPDWTYLPYDKDDEAYFGCDAVVRSEWPYVWQRRVRAGLCSPADVAAARGEAPPDLCGIALSGGGIRSASYCLGILQALSYAGWLRKLDYLSMVSGGSYIGGSLAWMLHREWLDEYGNEIPYGLNRGDFPFGSYPMVGMSAEAQTGTMPRMGRAIDDSAARASEHPWDVYKGRILGYLRQHASYLMPGDGINAMSLLAVALRNSAFSIVTYGGLLVVAFAFLGHWLFFLPNSSSAVAPSTVVTAIAGWKLNQALAVSALLGVALLLWAFIYPLGLYVIRRRDESSTAYAWRYRFERYGGFLLVAIGLLLVVGALPYCYEWLASVGKRIQAPAGQGLVDWVVDLVRNHIAPVIGAISTLGGGLVTLIGYFRGGKKAVRIPTGLLVTVGSACLIFGLLLLAYSATVWLRGTCGDPGCWDKLVPDDRKGHLATFAAGLSLLTLLLICTNLNYLSLHRYYRDRLMETFMPDLPDALSVNGPPPGQPKSADSTRLADIASIGCANQAQVAKTDKQRPLGPYPIVNANIVLVSSQIPKFRGRGGDNFILTPLYCGSNATGWCSTQDKKGPFHDLVFPTAIAISGAAIDPNTGCGGEGAMRSPLLAFLMGFFNVRLGYWAENPTPPDRRRARKKAYRHVSMQASAPASEAPSHQDTSQTPPIWRKWRKQWARLRRWPLVAKMNEPNVLYPGLSELWLRKNLDENSRWAQLSDGGHFENLGLYELIRRRLRLIIVCDGAAHPEFDFGDLGNAIEKVRADFGALIELQSQDLKALTPPPEDASNKQTYADRGYLVATITYNDQKKGTLIYMTSTFFKELSVDLHAYRAAHKEFPNQSTADQFFDEKQFEAYRELGYQTAYEMMKDGKLVKREDVNDTVGVPEIKRHAGVTP